MPVLGFISKGYLSDRVVLSYIFDYAVIVFFIAVFSALDLAEPYKQHFSLNNESLQYPYATHERITASQAAILCCLFPLAAIVFWTLCIDGVFSHHKRAVRRRMFGGDSAWTIEKRLWEMNCGILGLGMSVAGSIVITGALKNATGKPRPDVIDRCQPKTGSTNREVYGLASVAICTQSDNSILKDGFKSWPSGHASIAFAGLGFLSFYLAGKLHVMDARGEAWKPILVLIPFLAAALVAVSRIMDARHHPFDVITGSLLGFFVAWVSYRQYFPPLTETSRKGRAYPIRTWGPDPTDSTEQQRSMLNTRDLVADEEEGQKLGFQPPVNRTPSSTVAEIPGSVGGTGTGSNTKRNTINFSNESAFLQARKRENQRTAERKGSGFYSEPEEFLQGISENSYELRTPQRTDLYSQSRGSDESGDTRWGITRATAAITGDGAGEVGGFEESAGIGHTPTSSPRPISPPPKDDKSKRGV